MDEANESSKSCLHAACQCEAEGDGENYCSDSCRVAHLSGSLSSVCHCGHGGCEDGA